MTTAQERVHDDTLAGASPVVAPVIAPATAATAASAASAAAAATAMAATAAVAASPRATVTVETAVDLETAHRFWVLYQETFGDLAVKAVARQVLHYEEFMAEMLDPRVDKYLARDKHGEAVAMCTLTQHLETVPWISPAYFAHHYPEQTARGLVFYLGFILVAPEHRGERLFFSMIEDVTFTVASQGGVCAYDMCSYNTDVLGLADATEALLRGLGSFDVERIDTQSYFRAMVPRGEPLPEMRPRLF